MINRLDIKRAPYGIEDGDLRRTVQDIYDILNDIILAVNQHEGDARDSHSGKPGDLRVVKRGHDDYRLEVNTEDGWYSLKKDTVVPLDKPQEEDKNVHNLVEVKKLFNDWENYKGVTTCAYYKDGDRVWIKGQIKNDENSSPAGTDSVIFRLPEGFRPEATNIFATIVSGSTIGRIHVRKSGNVVAFSDNGTDKSAKLLTLDGISFKVRE